MVALLCYDVFTESAPLTLSIYPEQAEVLAHVATQTGKFYEELLHGAIEQSYGPASQMMEEEAAVALQRETVRKLQKLIGELSARDLGDGFSGRDHDKILYGRKA